MKQEWIQITGANEHNLKNWDVSLPLGKMTVVTGPSGSGKTSFALHTLYAEGQRRYVETFSPYIRQFLERMGRPNVKNIEPIPPALALEQRNRVRSSRSTVGTMTELTESWKYIFAHLAEGYHPETGERVRPESTAQALEWIESELPPQSEVLILFALPLFKLPSHLLRQSLVSAGYLRYFWQGELYRLDEEAPLAWENDKVSSPPAELLLVQDRIKLQAHTKNGKQRLTESLNEAFARGHSAVWLATKTEQENAPTWQLLKSFKHNWSPLLAPTPALFSFNSPYGACPECRGFGKVISLDLNKALHPQKSLSEGALWVLQTPSNAECHEDLLRCARQKKISLSTPFEQLPLDEQTWILEGEEGSAEENWKAGRWYGLRGFFEWYESRTHKMHVRIFLSHFRDYKTCPTCQGARLRPEALCFKMGPYTLPDLFSLPLKTLYPWVQKELVQKAQSEGWKGSIVHVIEEIASRLGYLVDVGLGYLTLERSTRSLSGGECERVNLTLSLGSSLTQTLFVLDEPTVGLHPHDTQNLVSLLHRLRDADNTLVVVEHEEAVIRSADWLVDIGPYSGNNGGQLLFQGEPKDLLQAQNSLTAQYLSGKKTLPLPTKRRKLTQKLRLKGATCHNIQNLDVDIPLRGLVCLSGVSGSGKSTLAHEILYLNLAQKLGHKIEDCPADLQKLEGIERLDSVLLVDQSPIVRTPRSTPALYMDAFSAIRTLFAQSPEAQAHGLSAGAFSFNSGEGRCARCSGMGFEKIEMQFLSDVFVPCGECEGKRYTPQLLQYEVEGKNLHEVLQMSVSEALPWLEAQKKSPARKAHKALCLLAEVGLGHLTLGQPLNTLSGGENQRLKLAKLISQSSSAPTSDQNLTRLLILDEPSTGLHFSDIETLLLVFERLLKEGYSLLVIEHNLEILKNADYLIDLGPAGGEDGGLIVAQGSPEEVALCPQSLTGAYLAPLLEKKGHISPPSPSAPLLLEKAPSPLRPYQQLTPKPEVLAHFPEDTGWISLRGARFHNLKNLDVDLPRGHMTVLSGLSGSGKSSLAFGLLFEEGQRRFLDVMSPYARQFSEQKERPERDALVGLPPTVAIEQNVSRGGSKSTVGTITEIWDFLRLLYAKLGTLSCPKCHVPTQQLGRSEILALCDEEVQKAHQKNHSIALYAPLVVGRKGHYKELAAWALKKGFEALIVDGKKILLSDFTPLDRYKIHDIDLVLGEWKAENFPPKAQWEQLLLQGLHWSKGTLKSQSPEGLRFFSTHLSCPSCQQSFEPLEPRLFSYNSPHGWCPHCLGHGVIKKGLRHQKDSGESALEAEVRYDKALEKEWSEEEDYLPTLEICPHCQGSRLNELARHVTLQGLSPQELGQAPIGELAQGLENWHFNPRDALIAKDALLEVKKRLSFLNSVGLNYLQLERGARTLSGGELQRIRLSAQLGSNLQGVLYVLDEPTIGLHPRDNERLLESLAQLKERGNSLLVVEHDTDILEKADWVIDLGPGAGIHGGEVVAQGSLNELKDNPHSVTGQALRHLPVHPISGKRRPLPARKNTEAWISLQHSSVHNLKNISCAFPKERLCVVSGVSGAGKTSLVMESLYPEALAFFESQKKPSKQPLAKNKKAPSSQASSRPSLCQVKGLESFSQLYRIDQSPIGRTPRSTPGTYVGFFDEIRQLFASTPEAKQRGFQAGTFSFNTASGRCESCKGNGSIKWEMEFMPASYRVCEVCGGKRYKSSVLEVSYQGKTMADVLDMNIEEAAAFFAPYPKIAAPLELLNATGLGYLSLGQASSTLSGGEAQRLKLVTELIRGQNAYRQAQLKGKQAPSALYLIEEPSIGLHSLDVRRLIDVLHRLVDQGNTVLVLEHHLEILAEADYLLDLGPEAGEKGGELLACGTPEEVVAQNKGYTPRWLAPILKKKHPKKRKTALD